MCTRQQTWDISVMSIDVSDSLCIGVWVVCSCIFACPPLGREKIGSYRRNSSLQTNAEVTRGEDKVNKAPANWPELVPNCKVQVLTFPGPQGHVVNPVQKLVTKTVLVDPDCGSIHL